MVRRGLQSFKDKKVVLLQGPVGPFFKNLGYDLENVGAEVYKINFNGGDWFFSSDKNIVNFRNHFDQWESYFTNFIETYNIDTVIFFGDCRKYHQVSHKVADYKGLDIGVFEEGYVRPDYITFEEFGVNGYSQLSRDPQFYKSLSEEEFLAPDPIPVGNTFWCMASHAVLYYFFSAVLYPVFHRYTHHRPLNPFETFYWIRSLWRKQYYKMKEYGMQMDLIEHHSKSYYLAPLQISTDAQVREHSDFSSVENFIERIIGSFSANAPKDTLLVIKHHPLDRGYHDYSSFIRRLAHHHNVATRVRYIHDQHLPSLLEHARGVVMINSTVGLSAIHHNAPVLACGTAIYDFEGMTYQGSIHSFWNAAETFKINRDLYHRFRGYVIRSNQINGSFYRCLNHSNLHSGVSW
ncbi:MAG: capsular biosynthesis protein [Sulfuricurvum sp.]|uniref:capsule biosynthesis protein n=1 Tax=Sulfuricurvum sp. TaxID=2025608 RepID=UPI002619DF92|nr:capsular biosynthesis protein [Sulfuricurvum sp.]MDD2828396.1 capsular biosynthesis protein [Sulfuricurvum sp.]MDD4949401.1 capsular biosynthesis protein [Sulfuricurvum sp.]